MGIVFSSSFDQLGAQLIVAAFEQFENSGDLLQPFVEVFGPVVVFFGFDPQIRYAEGERVELEGAEAGQELR